VRPSSVLLVLSITSVPAVAGAEPAPSEKPEGLAVGVEVGEPSALTLRWVAPGGLLGVGGAIGTGTRSGAGLSAHAEITVVPVIAHRARSTAVLLHAGGGVRLYRHGYDAMSVDEIPDAHVGLRAVLGADVVLTSASLELYLEVAPGYDVHRTASCTLRSGVDSVCPHAAASRGFVDVVLGARWYIGG
jgi:hypothetical protein